MPDPEKIITDYLHEQKLMQIATVSQKDGTRTCSVWYAVNAQLDLYFFSSTLREHSKELEQDPRVSGTVVKPHTPDEAPQGIQYQGVAHIIKNEEERAKARSLFTGRIFSDEAIQKQIDTNNHAFYKITTSYFKLIDPANFPDQPYQELTKKA